MSAPADFVEALDAGDIRAGKVSLRKPGAAGGGRLRRSTVSDMLNGPRVTGLPGAAAP
ncbi:hypothetical protein AB0D94_36005 [Streptomyces sp. NPDC048255]|uniref:hypothetical protein n=1 Tax=Streptomyces sp. NPDC048255 TaxID=3154713 RepID=UPI0034015C5A